MEPRVSIFWVNYNSSNFMNLALESLQAVKDIGYSNLELIIVDNGSADGSLAVIKGFVEKIRLESRIVSLNQNLGFTGGNNAAFATRDRNSKYVVLLNNDAVPYNGSLKAMVNLMETDETLGAAQGIILNLDEKSVDTAGDYITELFGMPSLLSGKGPQSLKRPVFITSADAAYSIFRVKAINKIPDQNKHLFDDYLFGHLDDHMLGLKLWNVGFKIKAFPVITAKHRRGSSFKQIQPLHAYLCARNLLILNEISNSRYKNLIRLLSFRHLSGWFFLKILGLNVGKDSGELPGLISKAFTDGLKIGRARHRLGEAINIYKAPVLKVRLSSVFLIAIRPDLAESQIKQELDRLVAW